MTQVLECMADSRSAVLASTPSGAATQAVTDYPSPLFLRERVRVRGSWLRSLAPREPWGPGYSGPRPVLVHSLTPALSRKEREKDAASWRRYSGRGLLMCALLLMLAFAMPAQAQTAPQSLLDTILTRGTVRVGMTGDYRPFSIKDGAGTFTGLDVDMAESLAHGLGIKLEIVPTAWPTLMADLQSSKFDIGMGGITVTLDRAKTAFFSAPVMRTGKTPIALCTNQARFGTLADIDKPSTRVITNPGGTNERFAREKLGQAQLTVYPNNVTIFEQIVAGKADLMVTDASETKLQQHLHPELCAVHPEAPFDYSEKAVLLPRDPVWKDYVDQWMHQRIATGAFQQAMDRWLAYPWQQYATK